MKNANGLQITNCHFYTDNQVRNWIIDSTDTDSRGRIAAKEVNHMLQIPWSTPARRINPDSLVKTINYAD